MFFFLFFEAPLLFFRPDQSIGIDRRRPNTSARIKTAITHSFFNESDLFLYQSIAPFTLYRSSFEGVSIRTTVGPQIPGNGFPQLTIDLIIFEKKQKQNPINSKPMIRFVSVHHGGCYSTVAPQAVP